MGDGEEQFLKENLTHFIQASGVPLPGLGDFGYYFLLSVQRQEHFVHSFHELQTPTHVSYNNTENSTKPNLVKNQGCEGSWQLNNTTANR